MSLNDESMMPPLPTPPYARPTVKTVYGQATGNDTVDLANQVTLLDSTDKQIGNAPYVVAMPSGEYAGQMHQLFIPRRNLGRSASFVVTGQFATFTMLLFSDIATSAVLSWDGSGWHVTGGNVGNSTGTLEDLWAGIGSFARVKNGALQIYNGADGLWHDAIAHNAGGVVGLQLAEEGETGDRPETPQITTRTKNGVMQVLDPDTRLWHAVTPFNAGGAITFQVEPTGEL